MSDVAVPQGTTIHPDAVEFDPNPGPQQKRIGWLFGGTGLALFFLMILVGLVMRFNQADVVNIGEDWFYRLMTLHASGMIAGVLLAMMGGLWYVVREVVSGLDYGRAVAGWVAAVAGVVLVLISIVFGGFAAGWTFLYPLPFDSAGDWPMWSTAVFLVGMALLGVGFVVYCIDVLKAVTEQYGGLAGALGVSWLRGRGEAPPPQVIAATAVTLQGIIAGAVGMTIVIALIDRVIDTTIVMDALWAKNLTYFFGHTLANLIIYLAAGLIYVLVPLYAGRQWKTSKPLVIGWLGTICFVLTAYAHHLYMDFVQPGIFQVVGLVASSAASLPVAVVTIYTAMMLIWGSKYRWSLTSVFLFLGFVGWAVGGAGAVIDSSIPVNFHFHNTLWVPAHFHNYMLMGVGLWVLAMVSYMLERASGRTASRKVTIFTPIAMLVGGYGLVYVWYFSGALGVPRRWALHPEGTEIWSLLGSVFGLIFLVGLIVLLFEFARMGKEAWARRGSTSTEPAPTVPLPAPVAGGSGFVPMIVTYRGLITAVTIAVAALFVFYPPIIEASEVSVKFHHLSHAVQFFAGAMLGAAFASSPMVLRRFPGGLNGGLIIALVAPVVMLLLMVPVIYGDLEGFLHVAYHLVMLVLGVITGLGSAMLGRVAGWSVLFTSVGMALLYAPGVTGG